MLVKRFVFKSVPSSLFDWLSKHPKTQVVASRVVAGEKHAIHCVNQTLKAFTNGENIASKPEIDIVLRIMGERQISKALAAAKPGKDCVFISWSPRAPRVWREFKAAFKPAEKPLREPSHAKLLTAMEKSATFWLFQ
ncbi:hypothetical protein HYS54_02060 [Candidatus Micrarchaeota archaeon]|nr:hypothetical protein [Candidatus Micrarchaeota archaeon]